MTPRAGLLLAVAGGSLLALIYVVGIVFEFEYPHWLLLRRVSHATSPAGTPVREILREEFGEDAEKVHWHTCGYCMDRLGKSDDVVYVQFSSPVDDRVIYQFAYSREHNQLTSAEPATAAAFPALRKGG